jgi:hypothetical protein
MPWIPPPHYIPVQSDSVDQPIEKATAPLVEEAPREEPPKEGRKPKETVAEITGGAYHFSYAC